MKFEDFTGFTSIRRRTDRYKGRGRPRKTDFGSQLYCYTKDGVYSIDFLAEHNIAKETMIERFRNNFKGNLKIEGNKVVR